MSLKEDISEYGNLESIVWAQEEHLNAGAWTFVQPRLQTMLKETKYAGMEVTYAGRGPSARYPPPSPVSFCWELAYDSVATGNKYHHKHEEETLLKESLGLPVDPVRTGLGVQ